MIYLDNAATTMPKPDTVYEAVNTAMRTCASLGRSGHPPAMEAARIAYECRTLAASLFETQPEQVVFTLNATHGLNIAIKSLVGAGDSVVISGFEHNAVLRPLYHMGADIAVAGSRLFDPEDTVRAFRKSITSNTKAVVCTHISNVFGYILPVEKIAALCAEREVPLILDAAQSAGCLQLSMEALHAAFVAMPGHKGLYGPQGTGLLLCGQMPKSLIEGGTGSQSAVPEMPDFLPDAVEAGTHNIPGIAGLLEGMRYIQNRGMKAILQHEQHLLEFLNKYMQMLPGIKCFYAGNAVQAGVLSFSVLQEDCEQTAAKLAEAGFAVRAGLHCAPLAHQSAGTQNTGTVRVSLSDFNTEEDIQKLAETLRKICG